MVSSRVGFDGGAALCAALSYGTSLQSIDLSDNPMEPAIGKDIAVLAAQHKGLKRLSLNDLCMGDEGTALLCGPLSQPDTCPQLEHIELSLNEISRESSPSVARMLASKKQTLRTVVLSENELECAGAIHVAAGLQGARALQELNLSTNMIGRVGALAVAKTCASVPKFQMLSLSDNVVSEEGVEEVRNSLLYIKFTSSLLTMRRHICAACGAAHVPVAVMTQTAVLSACRADADLCPAQRERGGRRQRP